MDIELKIPPYFSASQNPHENRRTESKNGPKCACFVELHHNNASQYRVLRWNSRASVNKPSLNFPYNVATAGLDSNVALWV